MSAPGLGEAESDPIPVPPRPGFAHLALRLAGGEVAVDAAAARLAAAGVRVVRAPRRTGDGYYECVVADRDGNLVELTA